MIMSYIFSPVGLVGVHLLWSDGRNAFIHVSVLNQSPSVDQIPKEFDDLSQSELLERFVLGKLKYLVVHKGQGSYRAVPADST